MMHCRCLFKVYEVVRLVSWLHALLQNGGLILSGISKLHVCSIHKSTAIVLSCQSYIFTTSA